MSESERHRRLAGCVPIKFQPNDAQTIMPSFNPPRLANIMEETLVLLITSRSHPDILVFPKGGVKRGETAEQAAKRETWEESGAKGQVLTCLSERAGLKGNLYNDDGIFSFDPESSPEDNNEAQRVIFEDRIEGELVVISAQNDTDPEVSPTLGLDNAICCPTRSHNTELSLEHCRWFLLLVEEEDEDWPERNQRQRMWMSLADAQHLKNIRHNTRSLLNKLGEFLGIHHQSSVAQHNA